MRPSVAKLVFVLGLLALRAPLWWRPGLGRDEATYVYWAAHFESRYAPLVEGGLAALRLVGAHSPAMLRTLSLLTGVAVLWLFHQWLRERGISERARALAVAAIALSPWQSYVASLIHPDGLLTVAALAFALSLRRGQLLGAAGAAVLALWAKPSGLVVVAVALLHFVLPPWTTQLGRRTSAAAILLVSTAWSLHQWTPEMLQALRSFGRISADVGPLSRAFLGAGSLAFLAGPLPLWAGVRAVRNPQLRSLLDPRRAGELLGWVYLLAFGVAALGLGQIKANWILPSLLLLWPEFSIDRRSLRWGMLFVPALFSGAMVVAFVSPATLAKVEERIGDHAPHYLTLAGEREAEVAGASRWWHRTAEYRSLRPWTLQLLEEHPELRSVETIVSDDYGLAAQLAMELERIGPTPVPQLVLPLDPLFARTSSDARAGRTLVLALHHAVSELSESAGAEFSWPHPITGRPLRLSWHETAAATREHDSRNLP